MTPSLESELAAGMRDAVARLHTDRALFESALAANRRRSVRLRAAAAGGVALVAAVVFGVSVLASVNARSTDVVNVSDPAAVTQQANKALDTDLIRHATNRITGWPTEGQITQEWYDPRTGDTVLHTSGGGFDVEDTRTNQREPGIVLSVNRTRHTWWSNDQVYDGPPMPEEYAAPPETPARIRALLRSGKGIRIVGYEQVNGHATIHIRMVLKKAPKNLSIVGEPSYDLWVDKTTFLPVRSLLTIYVQANPKFWPGGKAKTTAASDLEWLPRTQKNLARFKLTVPPGYTYDPPGTVVPPDPSGSATPNPPDAIPSPGR